MYSGAGESSTRFSKGFHILQIRMEACNLWHHRQRCQNPKTGPKDEAS
jgi:hypothetical protein